MLEPLLNHLNNLRVVLASSSDRRVSLLRRTKLKFEIVPSDFEENLVQADHAFSDYVEKTALGKVNDVWEKLKGDPKQPDIIIGVDTMVEYNGLMYGKPKTRAEAIKTVTDLTQARMPHHVYTGVAIRYKGNIHKFTECTTVYMDHLDAEEIAAYVDSGEAMGKAGSYGIQGVASTFIRRIEGDQNNVIGLPLCRLTKELKKLVLS